MHYERIKKMENTPKKNGYHPPSQGPADIRGTSQEILGKKADEFIDMVNSPPHYKQGKFETIEIIESLLSPEEFIGYLKGSFIKYISRAEHKGYLAEDLNKAEWFFNKYKQKQITHKYPQGENREYVEYEAGDKPSDVE
jgi:hypothetical protein